MEIYGTATCVTLSSVLWSRGITRCSPSSHPHLPRSSLLSAVRVTEQHHSEQPWAPSSAQRAENTELLLLAFLNSTVKISQSLLRTAVNLNIFFLPWLHLHRDVFGTHSPAAHFTQGAGAPVCCRTTQLPAIQSYGEQLS